MWISFRRDYKPIVKHNQCIQIKLKALSNTVTSISEVKALKYQGEIAGVFARNSLMKNPTLIKEKA